MPNASGAPVAQPLLQVFKHQLLPWARQWGMRRVLLAPHDLNDPAALQQWLASGASLTHQPIRSRRISVKGPRFVGNRSYKTAHWPREGLDETRIPCFACVIRGRADFQVGDYLLHCNEGQMIMMQPDVPRPDGSSPHLAPANRTGGRCDMLWISPSTGAGIGCWICCSEGERHYERPNESCYLRDPYTSQMFDALAREASGERKGHREICEYLLLATLASVTRELEEGRIFQFPYQKAGSSHQTPRAGAQSFVPAAQEYIRGHLHQPLQLDEIARIFFVSRTELTRRFRDETGQSFHEFLTQERMSEACNLLRTTDWSVGHISEVVGFRSSRLRVLFGRHYGVSPQQFRTGCRRET